MDYKEIRISGIRYLQELEGNPNWYWGSDYASGFLYEAEEIWQAGFEMKSNRLVFVSYPDGEIHEPVRAGAGQYFAEPVCHDGQIYCLLVDFAKKQILLLRCTADMKSVVTEAVLPLDMVEDTYNLSLATAPLMIMRQGREAVFEILWPEPCRFQISESESFLWREGDLLLFTSWAVEPEEEERVVVRRFPTGEVVRVLEGMLMRLPDGQCWLLDGGGDGEGG
ncbi:MAG: hypothetical protein QM296_00820 [Bacillota bacterium]|nr:hypothetical protein [Bacillota bacterium]